MPDNGPLEGPPIGHFPIHFPDIRHHQVTKHMVRQYRKHKRNPCPHAPAIPDNLTGEFKRVEGRHRHHRWVADLKWDEVKVDADGFPIIVRHYKVQVEYTADGMDWFVSHRLTVPAKEDADPNDMAHVRIGRIHGRLAYRFRVWAVGNNCKSDASSYYDLGQPVDTPPAPFDVHIARASHGIRVRWHAKLDEPRHDDDVDEALLALWILQGGPPDDALFHMDIDHFIAELWTNKDFGPVMDFTAEASTDRITITDHGFHEDDPVMLSNTPGGLDLPDGVRAWKQYYLIDVTTNSFRLAHQEDGTAVPLSSDGSGKLHWGMVRHARHIHKHHHIFRIDAGEYDEDARFYSRVESVSPNRTKSAFIPATAPQPNDDPLATPTGRRPAWHRRVLTWNVLGPLTETTYPSPNRIDDDYLVRRVTAACDSPGVGDQTLIDIIVHQRQDDGTYGPAQSMFDNEPLDMLRLGEGDTDSSGKPTGIKELSRGDHVRVRVHHAPPVPPANVTIHLISDREHADG